MLLPLLSIAITGAGSFYLGWKLFSGELQGATLKRLQEHKKPPSSALLKICRPLFRTLVLPYSAKLKLESWKKKNTRLLISAGLAEEIDIEELLAWKILLGFVIPPALYLYTLTTGSNWPFWLLPTMMSFGFMYPSLWVNSKRKKRHEEIKLQLPFVIDLLTLSTEAGLDFIGALQKVVEKTRPGPLVEEIEKMLQEIQLGATRAEAMRNFAWRIDMQAISSLVAVLVTADQMGSPLGGVLRVQSDLLRTKRFTEAEKKGAAASQKILFPLIFLIMPAIFIMIFGPVILGFFGVGSS